MQCICGANEWFNILSLENDRGTDSNYMGAFRVNSDANAGTTASISCSPNITTGFILDCGDQGVTLDWDVSSDRAYEVTVTLGAPIT